MNYNDNHTNSEEYEVPGSAGGISLTSAPRHSREGFKKPLVYGAGAFLAIFFLYTYANAGKRAQRELAPPKITPAHEISVSSIARLPGEYDEVNHRPEPAPQVIIQPASASYEQGLPKISEHEAALRKLLEQHQLNQYKMRLRATDSELVAKIDINQHTGGQRGASSLQNPFAQEQGAGGIGGGGGAGALNPRDDSNRQDEKYDFLNKTDKHDTHINDFLHEPISPHQIQAGTVLPAVLTTGINTDLPGYIEAQISENIYDTVTGETLLVPQYTRVLGEQDSRVTYGQTRLMVVWTRLILPNGKSISIGRMGAADGNGTPGLNADVNTHFWDRLVPGVVLGSVLGASMQIAEGSTNVVDPTFGQLATQGASQNFNQAAEQITQKNLGVQPTLTKQPGERVRIFAHQDITLEPYVAR